MPSTVLPESFLERTVWIQTRTRSLGTYVHTQVLTSTKHWEINLSYILQTTALDLGGTAQFTEKEQQLRGTWLTQSQKLLVLWDGIQIQVYYISFFKKLKKKKSCFSTEKAKAGRLPGVPGQLELHNEALSQNKQTSTHSLSKKKKTKRKRKRERWKEKHHKKTKSFSWETNTI